MKKHLSAVSQKPLLAQSSLCTDITDSSQAKLCFSLEVLTSFVLPVFDSKNPSAS